MKSFLSLGMGRSGVTLEPPRPASGVLKHQDEEALAKLWVDMAKTEAGCVRVIEEVGKYQNSIRNTQEAEKRLIDELGNSGLAATNNELKRVSDEYLSVVMEMQEKSENVGSVVQEVLGEPLRDYHAQYEHLDTLRRRRDAQLASLLKIQDKLDRLKIKGKRTTDVVVERDGALKQLRQINTHLLAEAGRFHALRLPLLQPCLQALVQTQVDYYGSANATFSSQVETSRGAHQIPTSQYEDNIAHHLGIIRDLKIVAS